MVLHMNHLMAQDHLKLSLTYNMTHLMAMSKKKAKSL